VSFISKIQLGFSISKSLPFLEELAIRLLGLGVRILAKLLM
jgi:hypothetical protein